MASLFNWGQAKKSNTYPAYEHFSAASKFRILGGAQGGPVVSMSDGAALIMTPRITVKEKWEL